MASESVKVVVRCRPLNNREKTLNCKMVVSVNCSHCQCFIEKPGAAEEPPKQFTFDGTYFIDQTTEQMYNEIAYPLVEVTSFPLWFLASNASNVFYSLFIFSLIWLKTYLIRKIRLKLSRRRACVTVGHVGLEGATLDGIINIRIIVHVTLEWFGSDLHLIRF